MDALVCGGLARPRLSPNIDAGRPVEEGIDDDEDDNDEADESVGGRAVV